MMYYSIGGRLESAGVTFICTYMTICFCEQVRLCQAEDHRPKFLGPYGLFIVMALMTGFGGRFAPNFIAINTMTVSDNDGWGLESHMEILPIVIALFVVVLCSFWGFYVSSYNKMFAKSKEEIVEMFVEDSKKLSFKQIQSITPMKMIFILCSKSWIHLVVGGVIQGSGSVIIKCLFYHATVIDYSQYYWNGGIIFAGVIVAWFVNIVSHWIMFRLISVYPAQEWLRILGAVVVTGGTLLTDLVIDAGVDVTSYSNPSNANVKPHLTEDQNTMHSIGIVFCICFCFVLMIIGFCDLRSWLYTTSSTVRKYEVLMAQVKKDYPVTVDAITAYIAKHDSMASRHTSDSSQRVSQSSGRMSSLVVSPTLKYFFTGAFLGRNAVSPQRPSRVGSSNRLQSDVENCRDNGSEDQSSHGRKAERVAVHCSSPGHTGRNNRVLKSAGGEANLHTERTIETTGANSVFIPNIVSMVPVESGTQDMQVDL